MTDAITRFEHEWRGLSNFATSIVVLDGVKYPTVEHAYQAAKTLDHAVRAEIRSAPTPGKAKRLGNNRSKVILRDGWDELRLSVMGDLCRQKFANHRYRALLVSTGDAVLVEGNDWHDTFYGVCTGCREYDCDGVGANELGKLLMAIRAELTAHG